MNTTDNSWLKDVKAGDRVVVTTSTVERAAKVVGATPYAICVEDPFQRGSRNIASKADGLCLNGCKLIRLA